MLLGFLVIFSVVSSLLVTGVPLFFSAAYCSAFTMRFCVMFERGGFVFVLTSSVSFLYFAFTLSYSDIVLFSSGGSAGFSISGSFCCLKIGNRACNRLVPVFVLFRAAFIKRLAASATNNGTVGSPYSGSDPRIVLLEEFVSSPLTDSSLVVRCCTYAELLFSSLEDSWVLVSLTLSTRTACDILLPL